MKKALSLFIAALMCISTASCMNDTADSTDTSAQTSAQTSDEGDIVYPHDDMTLAAPDAVIASVAGIDVPVFALRYFYANLYSDFYSTNYSDITSYFNPDVPLHDQTPKQEEYSKYGTWYDYFLEMAKKELGYYLAFASGAKQAGLELTAEEKAEVDGNIQSIADEAKEYDMSFSEYMDTFKMMGPGVTEELMKETYYIFQLATKYSQQLYDSFEISSDDIEEYFNEHTDLYTVADYELLMITPEFDATSTSEETQAAKEKASKEADDFIELVKGGKSFPEAYKEIYTGLSDDKYKEFEENCLVERASCYTENYYGESVKSDVTEWLFANGRYDGEIVKLTDSQGRIKVVRAVKTPYKMDWKIPNIRYIYIDLSLEEYTEKTAKELGDDIIEQIKNADDKDAKFIELVEQYSDDQVTNKTGGLVENLLPTSLAFPQNMVSWFFEDDRQLYDCGYVEYVSYGVVCGLFINFVSSHGEVYYEYLIEGLLRGEELSEYASGKLEELNVSYNSELVGAIYK